MKTKFIIYLFYVSSIVILIVCFPFILNYFLLKDTGCNVIGGHEAPKIWLGVWGSYAGGLIGAVLSSFVALFVLWKTLKENRNENRKQMLHDFEMQLRSDISQRLSILNSYISIVIDPYINNVSLSYEVQRIDAFDKDITNGYKSLEIKYGFRKHPFMLSFKEETEKFSFILSEIRKQIQELPPAHSIEEISECNSHESIFDYGDTDKMNKVIAIRHDHKKRCELAKALEDKYNSLYKYDVVGKVSLNIDDYIETVCKHIS